MAFAAILAYASGILFFVFWIYLNTKIVVSLVSKERYLLRVLAWVCIGLVSSIFVYALFMVFIMLVVIVANMFINI